MTREERIVYILLGVFLVWLFAYHTAQENRNPVLYLAPGCVAVPHSGPTLGSSFFEIDCNKKEKKSHD